MISRNRSIKLLNSCAYLSAVEQNGISRSTVIVLQFRDIHDGGGGASTSRASSFAANAYWLSKKLGASFGYVRYNKYAAELWEHITEAASKLIPKNVKSPDPRLGVRLDHPSSSSDPKNDNSLTSSVSSVLPDRRVPALDNDINAALEELSKPETTTPKQPAVVTKEPMPTAQPKSVPAKQPAAATLTVEEIESKCQSLLHSLVASDLCSVQIARLTELNDYMIRYPDIRAGLEQFRAISVVMGLLQRSNSEEVQGLCRESLAILGHVDPPRAPGVRILSIDGGGVRGILVIEILKQLERMTGRRIVDLFDYVVGVSTGAILMGLAVALEKSLDECDSLYRETSQQIFSQNAIWGTGKLVWSHSYYDTSIMTSVFQKMYGDLRMIDVARKPNRPKIAAVSVVVNRPTLVPFLFRNYNLRPREESFYMGACHPMVWQAVRASGSAPLYFEEFELEGIIHQDGGVMINNPTAAGIHEARLLWPQESIHCVVSIGSGRYIPEGSHSAAATSLKTKLVKIIDSATDTEAVHTLCNDLLPAGSYFRFNPYLSESITLDETRAEKLDQLKLDAQMYMRRNDKKLEHAAQLLIQPRSVLSRASDYLRNDLMRKLY